MSHRIKLAALALLAAATACSDQNTPTSSSGDGVEQAGPAAVSSPADERASRERLARQFALALGNATFRARVKAQLERSPVRERKVHFQRYLKGEGRTALRTVAGLSAQAESALEADAARAVPLEMYFPVPAHRARWAGGSDILVATEREDGETPVAFDIGGGRHLLSRHSAARPRRSSRWFPSKPISTVPPLRPRSSAAREALRRPPGRRAST